MAQIDAKSCIAGQYDVLRRIFSFLTSKDLVVMTHVCKHWRSIASKFLNKTIQCYELTDDTVINSRLVPKILLFFREVNRGDVPRRMSPLERRSMIDSWKHKFSNNFMKDASAIFFMARNSLMCTVANGLVQRPPDDFVGEHVLVIPEMPGVSVELVSVHKIRRKESTFLTISARRTGYVCRRRRVNLKELLSSSKLVVIFSRRGCSAAIDFCLLSSTSPVVGGVPAGFFVDDKKRGELALLSFAGDNVEAYTDILRVPSQSDRFFEKLAAEVGPFPPGAQRFAFLFASTSLREVFKTDSFVKHFPNVPFYGMWSYMELARPSRLVNRCNVGDMRCVSVAVVTIRDN